MGKVRTNPCSRGLEIEMISMNPWFAMCIERKIYIDIGVCGPSARARTHTHSIHNILY